eukprot:CAMPEP_0115853280 /NCGR_PEP_ID=MMETSP0287-20121206/13423_1 /TAXON_ID=412157 /ORGANISM="Chrysochromulina rotalis, Strain UIO044" /LENGTH=54 /DNA_ID=CAMNT_0003307353 /DNA_START=397 /DNA_END=561 /DNA_ORIENTATION=-
MSDLAAIWALDTEIVLDASTNVISRRIAADELALAAIIVVTAVRAVAEFGRVTL